MDKIKVDFTKKDLKKITYWIVSKFQVDEYHHNFSGGKRDLIGAFIDRWINRAPEFLIFNKLLEDKNYSVVTDTFLYAQDTNKNSPDVIGLKDKKDNLYKFSVFNDGSWNQVESMPFIEMKTFREDQKIVTIPESQFYDDNYYAIVESHIFDNYLIALFKNSFFDNEYYDLLKMDDSFIENDGNNLLIRPNKLEKLDNLGYFVLLGVFKGFNIKKSAIVVNKGDKPSYLVKVEEMNKLPQKRFLIDEVIYLENGLYKSYNGNFIAPFNVTIDENSTIRLLAELKSYVFIEVNGSACINNVHVKDGYYKLHLKDFDKRSKDSEIFVTKQTLLSTCDDETEDLINIFDGIVGN